MIIWLASYPRSGNTFLRIILNKVFGIQNYSVYNDLKDIEAHEETKEVVGHLLLPKNFSAEDARRSSEKFFIKTHKHPSSTFDKVIYLVRDGRDSIASYYHYRNEYNNAPPVLDFIEGKTKVGSWSEHIEKWTSIRADNLLLITFEELVSGSLSVIDRIAKFIVESPLPNALPDFQELNKINPKFFREGKKGTYKELFSEHDHLFFWQMHHAQMIRFNYTNDIPEPFKKLIQSR